MNLFLGVDGGGTKTDFLLIDETGRVLARHREASAYYLEIGLEPLGAMLDRGIERVLAAANATAEAVRFAFFGLPAYGEDSRLQSTLDAAPGTRVPAARYRCGNDVICGWAGALAAADGIHLVCGTGSIGYGEYLGRQARAGGWGELFSDEASAYWVAREGLQAFSRMSDGRAPRGALYGALRAHFALGEDLDLCGAVYGTGQVDRSRLAQLAPVIAEAALQGDPAARGIFESAVRELAAIVRAVRARLEVPAAARVPVSYSGGMFKFEELLLRPLGAALAREAERFEFVAPSLPPDAGAALYAAKLASTPLDGAAVERLRQACAAP